MTVKVCASRTLLLVVNSLFLVVGMSLAVCGGILAWNYPLISTLLDKHVFANLQQTSDKQSAAQATKELVESLIPFGLGFFVIGMVICGLCLLALIGTIYYNRCILTIYLILHGILLLTETVVLVVYASKPTIITDHAHRILKDSMSRYVSVDSPDKDSLLLNVIMIELKCCGLDSKDDFRSSPNYQSNNNNMNYTSPYPPVCCKFNSDRKPYPGCPPTFTDSNSNVNIGCWNLVKAEIDRYGTICLYSGIGVAVFQFLLAMACVIVLFSEN